MNPQEARDMLARNGLCDGYNSRITSISAQPVAYVQNQLDGE